MSGKTMLSGMAALAAICVVDGARADPVVLDCYNVKGEVIACRGNFPDGTAASNADFTLYSKDNQPLGSGKTDENGVYLFKAPPDEYIVVIGLAPSLRTTLDSSAITAEPQRPGWNGDWVPITAVDKLDQLKQWEDQFIGEKPPLIQKIEEDLDK